jgi:phosphoglucomutase
MQSTNSFIILTGNQIGALLLEYILNTKKQENTLPQNGVIMKTIVTSELGRKITKAYDLETWNTLTGFKFIGHKIKEIESANVLDSNIVLTLRLPHTIIYSSSNPEHITKN